MVTKKGTEETQWYTVFKDQKSKEYKNKADAVEAMEDNGWFVVEDIYKGYCEAGYWWKLSDFKFYDKAGEKIELSVGKWKIIKIDEICRKSDRFEVEFTFQDPQKEIKRHKFSDKSQGSLRFVKIFEAIDYLENRASSSSWREYTLSIENQRLKEQIIKLKEEIRSLSSSK